MDCLKLKPVTAEKLSRCREVLRSCRRVVVAFSAGVDSTLLLALAGETLGPANALAAIGVSPSLPQRERQEGLAIAARLGIELVEVVTGELHNPQYAENPANRCYFCKSDLFTRLADLSRQRGFPVVVSGANADDLGDFRPGLAAGRELGVRNPLMEAGLTKAEVREISHALHLPTADKPAMACLASRIPYGQRITRDGLARVEAAEDYLKALGFGECRVRAHDTLARIEIPPGRFDDLLRHQADVLAHFKKVGFAYVALDLQGLRSGSMNEVLGRK